MKVSKKTFLSFVSFFCGIVKLFCEVRHTFFINLRLQPKLNLWLSALFYKKNLCSVVGKSAHSVICGNTFDSPFPHHIIDWFTKPGQVPENFIKHPTNLNVAPQPTEPLKILSIKGDIATEQLGEVFQESAKSEVILK